MDGPTPCYYCYLQRRDNPDIPSHGHVVYVAGSLFCQLSYPIRHMLQ